MSILLILAAIIVPDPVLAGGLYVCALLVVLSSAGVLFVSLFNSFIAAKIE